MEGVLHRLVTASAPNAPDTPTLEGSQIPTISGYPVVALFLSLSPFTRQALLRVHSSPLPFCLLHLPVSEEALAAEEVDEDDETPEHSIIFNHALSKGVLNGEVEARWERSMQGGGGGRPGLWFNGSRIPSWIPESSHEIPVENTAEPVSPIIHRDKA